MDEYCYFWGGMLFVDVVAGASVTARICSGWFNFRSLACLLTAKDAGECVLTYLLTFLCVHSPSHAPSVANS